MKILVLIFMMVTSVALAETKTETEMEKVPVEFWWKLGQFAYFVCLGLYLYFGGVYWKKRVDPCKARLVCGPFTLEALQLMDAKGARFFYEGTGGYSVCWPTDGDNNYHRVDVTDLRRVEGKPLHSCVDHSAEYNDPGFWEGLKESPFYFSMPISAPEVDKGGDSIAQKV